MFDSYTIERHATEYVTQNIHEHRAPTDESVRLLKELENKAIDKLLHVVELKNNVFNATWFIGLDHISLYNKVYCIFKLNGLEYKIDFIVKRGINFESITEQVYGKLIEKMSEILTLDMFNKADIHDLNKLKI